MAFLRGSCGFGRMKMSMERHGLRAYQPMNPDGSVDCAEPANIDFSMGFPEPWHLVYTDFKVPSEHTLDGKRYDAEIVLAHIYSVDKPNKHVSFGVRSVESIETVSMLTPNAVYYHSNRSGRLR